MANIKPIKRDSFYRGDTIVIQYVFGAPYAGYNWSQVVLGCTFTNVTAPNDNSGAAAVRNNQSLTVNTDGSAYYNFQLTHLESAALIPGATYQDQCQLIENGTNYLTPITGQTVIAQDYYI